MALNKFSKKLFDWFKYYDPKSVEVLHAKKLINLQGKTILEIGCGTGKTTLQICKDSKKYYAIDKDKRMINFCKNKYPLSGCCFLMNDVEKLTFKKEFFDVVISPWVFNYIKDKNRALNEIHRVLKKGGHFLLVESSENSDFDGILKDIIKIEPINPYKTYEKPIQKKFTLIKKTDPIKIPYIFPNFSKAFELIKFIVNDYLGISLTVKQITILKKNLMEYKQDNGQIIFYEEPLFYLFKKP